MDELSRACVFANDFYQLADLYGTDLNRIGENEPVKALAARRRGQCPLEMVIAALLGQEITGIHYNSLDINRIDQLVESHTTC